MGPLSSRSLNKSSWKIWVVLKRTDRCQIVTSYTLSSCPANAPSNPAVGFADGSLAMTHMSSVCYATQHKLKQCL